MIGGIAMMDYAMGWGFGGFTMIIFRLVPLILVLVGIRYLYSGGESVPGKAVTPSAPLAANLALSVLEERYAEGEIDRGEFLRKRGDILGA
jgi:putative membrane protein